jgi:hypothetical protein
VAGFDGYHFLDSDREWVVNGRLVFSDVAGTPAAIERLQLEPQRYFQRTQTPEVSFDPSRRSLRGWNGDINVNRNQGGWTVNAALWAVSPGFESGDLGFHFNGDVWGNHVAFTWKQLQPDRFTRYRDVTVAKFYVWDFANRRLGDGEMSFGNVTFLNYWNTGGSIGVFQQTQDDRLTRGGPPGRQPAQRVPEFVLEQRFPQENRFEFQWQSKLGQGRRRKWIRRFLRSVETIAARESFYRTELLTQHHRGSICSDRG